MSKLAMTPFQAFSKKSNDTLRANIESRCAWFGLHSDEQICNRIGMKYSTYRSRKRDPSGWRQGELVMAAYALKVSVPWLMTDHSKVEEVT